MQREVTVRLDGQNLFVEPLVPELQAFRTSRVESETDRRGRTRLVQRSEPLRHDFEPNPIIGPHSPPQDIDQLGIPAGLAPAVEFCLRNAGYAVRIIRVNWNMTAIPLPCVLERRTTPSAMIGERLHEYARGLFIVPPGCDPLKYQCADIALMFPDTTIAFICDNKTQNAALLAELIRKGIPAIMSEGGSPDETSRVIVGTPLSTGLHDWGHRGLVILPRARDALGHSASISLPQASMGRIFGFIELQDEVSAREQDVLHGYFGFHRWILPRANQAKLEVEVAFPPIDVDAPVSADTLVELLRAGVWTHAARNNAIVHAVHRVLSRNFASLGLSRAMQAHLEGLGAPRITIITANRQHATALGTLLPDFAVETAETDVSQNGFGVIPTRRIVTLGRARTLNFAEIDVLIRADAGIDAEIVPSDCVTTATEPWRHRVLLVDFDDAHNRLLRNRSMKRLKGYVAGGMRLPGELNDEVAARWFLGKIDRRAAL